MSRAAHWIVGESKKSGQVEATIGPTCKQGYLEWCGAIRCSNGSTISSGVI